MRRLTPIEAIAPRVEKVCPVEGMCSLRREVRIPRVVDKLKAAFERLDEECGE